MDSYQITEVEKKWRSYWERNQSNKTVEDPENKFYVLEMFPYPSGDLHIGHLKNYVIGDIISRLKKMQGFQVLHPMGFDGFGLPAENAAIERGVDPSKWTFENIKLSRATFRLLGLSYDWDRAVITCQPEYYKWTQWIFIQLFKKGFAYKKRALVNWCPKCQTVLANEQVEDDACYRCDTKIDKKELEQWYFKITAYADRLLKDIDIMKDWPARVKTMQRNWIGFSEGANIDFDLSIGGKISVYTTRPDTLFGVTFMAIAPENPVLIEKILPESKFKDKIENYINSAKMKTEIERTAVGKEKDGVYTGIDAINPLSGEKVQLWVADYVLSQYGTGIVMGVPAHDQRDFEFSKKYNIPIKVVINPPGEQLKADEMTEAYVEPGVMINSEKFNGKNSKESIKEIIQFCKEQGVGDFDINYRIRDWSISRQRYWGCPIPIIYCETCGVIPIPEAELPVLLPSSENIDFVPKGTSPLGADENFINVTCPACGGSAHRDPDTMDTFVDSSWYFLRYADPTNTEEIFSNEKINKWLPIDFYIGGVEHATGHLLYSRFFTKFFEDIGLVNFSEFADRLFLQGMVTSRSTKDGKLYKMSKSKYNAVPVGPFVEASGADTARFTILSAAPPEDDMEWTEDLVESSRRFINRVWRLYKEFEVKDIDMDKEYLYWSHKTIRDVTRDFNKIHFNTAIAFIRIFVNFIYKHLENETAIPKKALEILAKLLAPIVPHLSEELWEMLGHKPSIFDTEWETFDPTFITTETINVVVQINGKVRAKLQVDPDINENELKVICFKDEKVKKYTEGKEIRKIIVIPKKIISIVVK
ncbi:leucine--tRNA ligase [Candidatus Dependentiae bacterium]|nr:leucine--tRNA ligase [Candidatus Dependentiae bacterium]